MIKRKYTINFLSDKIPYPPDKDGFTINVFNIIKELGNQNKFTINFILHCDSYSESDLTIFKEFVDELIIKPALNQYTFFLRTPFIKKKTVIDGPLFFCNYDSGIYESLYISDKKILYTADSPTFHHSKGNTLISKIFFFKHFIQESYLFSRFEDIIFVSKDDYYYSKKRVSGNGHVIPIGYDEDLITSNLESNYQKKYDFVFSGNFGYSPNSKAAEDFLENNVPKILSKIPDATFYLVGRKPSQKMNELGKKYSNVTISGEVESIEDELKKARIYFSNLSKGSGMKNKILQAMLSKLPIVCTKESWSGFSDNIPAGVIITNNRQEFNEVLIKLYGSNQEDLNQKGEVNCLFFKTNYTWKGIVQRYYLPILIK